MPEKKSASIIDKIIPSSVFDATDVLNPQVGHRYFSIKNIILGCIILTAIVILGIALYYFVQNRHAQDILKNPILASEMTQEKIVANVGKLTTLPTGEKPAIAKVSDVTKLQNQPFFQNAKNGDYVLIYTKAKEAILYDPMVNKVLRVGPILVPSPTAGTNQWALGARTSNKPVTVALYNGTTIRGLTRKVQQDLVIKISRATVVENSNASKQDYKQTIVIDLTGKNSDAAIELASVLHGTVGSLPAGEVKPINADLLVILGSK
jgi:hypothetical protein